MNDAKLSVIIHNSIIKIHSRYFASQTDNNKQLHSFSDQKASLIILQAKLSFW